MATGEKHSAFVDGVHSHDQVELRRSGGQPLEIQRSRSSISRGVRVLRVLEGGIFSSSSRE